MTFGYNDADRQGTDLPVSLDPDLYHQALSQLTQDSPAVFALHLPHHSLKRGMMFGLHLLHHFLKPDPAPVVPLPLHFLILSPANC